MKTALVCPAPNKKDRPGMTVFCCEPHRTRTCNQGIKSTRNGRCTIPIQGLLPAMPLLHWCASSPLDFSVRHEPKRCKHHYTQTLCRVNGKFGLCRDLSGDRKVVTGRRAPQHKLLWHHHRWPVGHDANNDLQSQGDLYL